MARSEARPYWRDAQEIARTGAGRRAAPDVAWTTLLVAGLLCGALGVIAFQEAALFLLQTQGRAFPGIYALFGHPAPAAFRLQEGWLPGVPALAGEVLWGAAWGVVLAWLIGRGDRLPALLTGTALGAVVLASLSIAFAPVLRGLPPFTGTPGREAVWTLVLIHAAWGWGTASMLRLVIRR